MFCLNDVDDEKPPTVTSAKAVLSNYGLGPGCITCNVHVHSIHNYVMERFLPLALAGGCVSAPTPHQSCFAATMMSHTQQEMLQMLLDGHLWFMWTLDH